MIRNTALAMVLACAPVVAQAPVKIGVINLQQAIPATAEGQAAVAKLQKEFVEPRTKALEAMQAEIKELNDKLQRGASTLSQTAKDDLQNLINQKTKLFNRAVEDYDADSEEQQRKLLGDLSAKFQAVMQQFGRDNGYAVILDAANPNTGLVWSSDAVEITQAVIDAYDKAHPLAASPAPAKPAAAGAKPAATPAKPAAPASPPEAVKPAEPAKP